MSESTNGLKGSEKIGVAVLVLATVLTATMIWFGVTGHPLPRWVIAATTVL